MSKNEGTEKPTEKRIRDARKDGQSPRTAEIGNWAAVLAASWLAPMGLSSLMDSAQLMMRGTADFIAKPDTGVALRMLGDGLGKGAWAVTPLLAGTVVATLVAAAAQGSLRPSPKLLIPKFNRLNPLPGFKRMFGPQAAWETAKTLMKTAVLAIVLYMGLKDLVPTALSAGTLPLSALVGLVGDTILTLIRWAGVAGLVLGVVDYFVSRRRVMKELKMTHQQIREEHRNSDGDPQLKAAIRQKQMAMGRNRMMADVPEADVVLVNPTHVAVALRYDPAKGAPRVVAKGADAIAARIRDLATEHRVPIVRDVPLARALHKACEVGQEIPADLFEPVAHVLAFLYRLKRKGSAAGIHTMTGAA